MVSEQFQSAVIDRLRIFPYLHPVFSHPMADLMRQYDNGLFLVWNNWDEQYEVHNLGNQGLTYGFAVPDNTIDSRIETLLRKGDVRVRGDEIFMDPRELRERAKRSQQGKRRNDLRGIAEEIHPAMRALAWEGY